MKQFLRNHLLIFLGWIFLALGAIGAVLPILPTTPFLIVALALFSKSSPRFHQMLLNNDWFGPTLRQWEETRTLSRKTKYKVYAIIVAFFSLSIAIFHDKVHYQLMLAALGVILLAVIWRIKEPSQ
ncbi:MAG: YbaN family protein [Desulfofustis sp.]|nr:YbaN family protein [Desulfofustis sp.]